MPLDPLPSHTSNFGPWVQAKLGKALAESLASGELSLAISSLAENTSVALRKQEDLQTDGRSAQLPANEAQFLSNALKGTNQEFDQGLQMEATKRTDLEDAANSSSSLGDPTTDLESTEELTSGSTVSVEDLEEECRQVSNQGSAETETLVKSTSHEDVDKSQEESTAVADSTEESISGNVMPVEDSVDRCNQILIQGSAETEALWKSTNHEDAKRSSSSLGMLASALASSVEPSFGSTAPTEASLEKVSASAVQPVSSTPLGRVKGRKRAAIKRFFSGLFA